MPTESLDEDLAGRVRKRLREVSSHANALEVRVEGSRVSLSGPAYLAEVDCLLREAGSVPGVEAVDERLDVLAMRAVPTLAPPRRTPAERLALLAGGVLLGALAARNRGLTRAALGALAGGAVLRGLTSEVPVLALGSGIVIDAPVDEVYSFLSRFENYPRFFSYIDEVRINEEGGLHWSASGPGRLRLEWDTHVTSLIPRRRIEWKSAPGSRVRSEGRIVLRERLDRSTQVEVSLLYAALAGIDPRLKIDEDLGLLRAAVEAEFRAGLQEPETWRKRG